MTLFTDLQALVATFIENPEQRRQCEAALSRHKKEVEKAEKELVKLNTDIAEVTAHKAETESGKGKYGLEKERAEVDRLEAELSEARVILGARARWLHQEQYQAHVAEQDLSNRQGRIERELAELIGLPGHYASILNAVENLHRYQQRQAELEATVCKLVSHLGLSREQATAMMERSDRERRSADPRDNQPWTLWTDAPLPPKPKIMRPVERD